MNHLCLIGTTASGKSSAALAIARKFVDHFEIVSVDSMAVYRNMNIGTASPSEHDRAEVVHHMIDICDPSDDFTLSQFQERAREVIADIESRDKRAILVGGTGLYVRALIDPFDIPPQFPDVRAELENETVEALRKRLEQLDPLGASRVPENNKRRLVRALEVTIGSGKAFSSFGEGIGAYSPTKFTQLAMWMPRAQNNIRIAKRVDAMIRKGWIEETRELTKHPWSRTARQAIGYKQWQQMFNGELTVDEARASIIQATSSFARKQRMWFRRDPRIKWFGTANDADALVAPLLEESSIWLERELANAAAVSNQGGES